MAGPWYTPPGGGPLMAGNPPHGNIHAVPHYQMSPVTAAARMEGPEIERLRAALAFYADGANWRTERGWRIGSSFIQKDRGARARRALGLA